MDQGDTFGKVINNNLSSSMKYINLEGLSKEQISDKYEQLLFQREKHYKDLVTEIGTTNKKYFTIQEKVDILLKENEELSIHLVKSESQIQQEMVSKEVMYIKLTNLVKEHDKLKQMILGNLTEQNKNLNDKINKNKENNNRRVFSVDVAENRNNIKKSQTLNLINSSLNMNKIPHKKEDSKSVKKKNSHKHKKDSNGKLSLTMKKTKKLESEDIDYEPVFK